MIYCRQTGFQWLIFRVSFKQTCVVITIIRQGLVSARNIHNDGALANLKIFSRSQIYKSWFTISTVVSLLFICIKLIYLNLTTTESFFYCFLLCWTFIFMPHLSNLCWTNTEMPVLYFLLTKYDCIEIYRHMLKDTLPYLNPLLSSC